MPDETQSETLATPTQSEVTIEELTQEAPDIIAYVIVQGIHRVGGHLRGDRSW